MKIFLLNYLQQINAKMSVFDDNILNKIINYTQNFMGCIVRGRIKYCSRAFKHFFEEKFKQTWAEIYTRCENKGYVIGKNINIYNEHKNSVKQIRFVYQFDDVITSELSQIINFKKITSLNVSLDFFLVNSDKFTNLKHLKMCGFQSRCNKEKIKIDFPKSLVSVNLFCEQIDTASIMNLNNLEKIYISSFNEYDIECINKSSVKKVEIDICEIYNKKVVRLSHLRLLNKLNKSIRECSISIFRNTIRDLIYEIKREIPEVFKISDDAYKLVNFEKLNLEYVDEDRIMKYLLYLPEIIKLDNYVFRDGHDPSKISMRTKRSERLYHYGFKYSNEVRISTEKKVILNHRMFRGARFNVNDYEILKDNIYLNIGDCMKTAYTKTKLTVKKKDNYCYILLDNEYVPANGLCYYGMWIHIDVLCDVNYELIFGNGCDYKIFKDYLYREGIRINIDGHKYLFKSAMVCRVDI